jgi:toxin FitB
VTRYLLDTNIISNIIKPTHSESLLAWVTEQREEDLFASVFTIAEIRLEFYWL